MSKYTAEQIRACILAYKAGDLNYCRAGIIDLMTDYAATVEAAHLAAQAEWPSEEDVRVALNAFHDGDFPHWESTEYSREGNMRDMRAALQSVRPPVGVVSDEEVERIVEIACQFKNDEIESVDDLYAPMRSAIEAIASRHAPTKD